MLPPALFRTHYETSNTLSRYVDKHTHPKHRSNIQLKIKEGYAFESIGAFHLERGLTRERIERHLVWNKKIDPSALISAFNDISEFDHRTIPRYFLTRDRPRKEACKLSLRRQSKDRSSCLCCSDQNSRSCSRNNQSEDEDHNRSHYEGVSL
jgi:hypothetical protein